MSRKSQENIMSSKKRIVEKIADSSEEKAAKKNKSATSQTTSPLSADKVFLNAQFTEKQQQRIRELKSNSPLPEFTLHFLVAPNSNGIYTSTRPENLELFLKVLTATRAAPFGWPKIVDFDASKEILFDISGLKDFYTLTPDVPIAQTMYGAIYSQFYPMGVISSKLRRNVTKENLITEDVASKFLPMPRNETSQINNVFRRVAEIVKDYIQRLEILDEANQLQNDDRVPLETCLLFEPFDLLCDAHNKFFHLPLVDGVTSHKSFVPAFVNTLKKRFDRLRTALLISLARFAYGFAFGRSFDSDFNVAAKDYATWKASVKAETFPVYNYFGSSSSVFLIKWIIECMCNTISTDDITQHKLFTSPRAEIWRSAMSLQSSVPMTQRRTFYSLFDPLTRVNNSDIIVSIDMKSVPNGSTRTLYTKNFEAMTESEKSDCDVSLRVYSRVLAVLHDTQRPDYGFSLSFAYEGVAANGIGVSREIVLRTLEALKKWQAFNFREEEDMLECAFLPSMFAGNRILQKCMEFLFVLIYWSVVNDEPIPYMISPTILHILFGLRSNYVAASAFDHLRLTHPSLANGVLSIKDDEKSVLLELGSDGRESSLDVLSHYFDTNKYTRYNTIVVSCLKSIEAHPVFRHFYLMVRELYDTSESLIFLITHRLYGSEMAKKDTITAELAVSLICPENIDLKLKIEHSELLLSHEIPMSLLDTSIIDHVLHHENRMSNSTHLPSFFFIETAKRKAYMLFVRWLLEADSKKLAKLWQLLKGTPTLIHAQVADIKIPNLEIITSKVREATEKNPADQLCSTEDKLQHYIDRLSDATSALLNVHRQKHKNSICVTFRSAASEKKYHMAPHFASCSGTLSLSICHFDYHSFSESMNLALSDDVTLFTLNT